MADTWGESDKPVKTASNQGEAWGEGDSAVPASALRKVGDLGLSVAKGVVAVPEALVGLADIPTGGRVGKFLENEGGAFGFRPKQAKEYLGGLQSDDLRDKQQQFQKADWIIDKAGVALSNPSLITNAVAESVPLMGAGAVPARGLMAIGARGVPAAGGVGPALPGVLARTVGQKTAPVVAGAIGEGVVGAGSAAEGIRQETADGLMTAGQSGLALASGAATSVFGFAGGKLAQRLGIGDVDTMLTQGVIKTAGAPSAKSIPRQVVEGAIAEGWLEELPQSVSEQVLHNLALDKPWHEGVSDAAVMGTLAGMAMGGGAAGVSGFAQDAPPADAQQPPAAPPAPPQPQAGPALALPAPDPGVIAVGGDGTARTPAYQKPSFAGEYADVTDVVPRALAPQPADPVRAAVESAANAGGALSGAALVAIDSGVTPPQEGAFEDVQELGAQPPQVNLDDIADPYDRAYYESLFDDDPAPLGAPPVLSAFLQDDDNIPDFDAANSVSEEDFLRALGADEQEIQDAIATTPDRAESAPEGAALPAGPQANVTAGTPEGAGAGAEQPAGPVADAPTNLRDALAKVRAQKQEAANAQAAQAPAPAAAPAPGPTGAAAVEAAGVAPQASIQAITAKQIPDMTDAELQAAIVHYGPAHKRTAKLQKEAQRRVALAPQSQPNGAPNVPQADQAQQAAAQPAQAGPAQPAQGLTDAAAAQNHGAQGTPAPGAQAQTSDAAPSDKAKWIKAAVDKSRLNGGSGVQLTVTPQGEVTFSGDPRSTKEGKALLATYEEALRAGATKKEIADALMAARGQAAARPDVTLTNEGDTTPAAAEDSNGNQAQTTSQQAQVATESGAPAETREQRAQRVAEAGESWTRMPTVEREALAARAAGLNPIQRKNVPKSTWANLNASIQRRLADVMGGRAEYGQNQAPGLDGKAQKAIETVAPSSPPVRIGRDQTPLNEGGKPFKTRKAAGDAKKLQPMMRVVTVEGGYALAEKTPAQLAAEAKAARRLSQPKTGAAGAPLAAHEFIAAEGGLNAIAASDLGIEGNPRIGNRRLFAGLGRGLSVEQATQKLIAHGYLGEGATLNDAYALIKTSLSRPQYNADGIERIGQAEADAQFEDYLAAQEEAADDGDPWGDAQPAALEDFTGDMLESSGYDAAADAIKAEVRALLEMSNALGIDAESITLDAHEQTINATEQDYYAAAKSALEAAIARSNGDRRTPAGSESQGQSGAATGPAAQELNQPETLATQAQEATESVAPESLELASQTPAEAAALQEAQEQAAKEEAAAKRAADAAAAKDEDRKRIAQASVRAAGEFELGQDPMDSLTGQGSVFDASPEPKPKTDALTEREKAAKSKMLGALGKLAALASKNTRMNWTPEEEQKLLPIVIELFDGAIELGAVTFQKAVAYVRDFIAQGIDQETADAIPFETLQGAYIAVAGRHKDKGVTAKKEVAGFDSLDELQATAEQAPEGPPAVAQGTETLTLSLYKAIRDGGMPKDNPALKKLVEAFDGKPADPARMKQAQDELETAIAMSARDIVAKGESDKATFDALLRMYESQPNLNIRTSTSVANQAYSTPAPLAFLASRLAGITRSTVAHEPTGGTGMLLIGADPKKALVNELNDLRISALKAQGFAPTQKDAATMLLVPEGTRPDAVVTNPPFGSVKDADGKPVKVKVDGFSIGQIDHLIAARALQTIKDDGKATLILGANKVAGGLSTDDRIFFNWLYSHYNVSGHFEVEGDLYARQGAGWPVRVITINGRQKSGQWAPVAGTIQRADNWSQVYEQFTKILDGADTAASTSPAPDSAGGGAVAAVTAPAAPGGRRPEGGAGSPGSIAGALPGVVPDSTKPATQGVGSVPDEQRLNAQSFVPQPRPDQNPAGPARPEQSAGAAALDPAKPAERNEFQVSYTPRSARKDEGVLIPSNMAQPTQDALSRLEDEVGDIDEFARSELGYATVADLHSALMGLQVDSVAMAIHQIKRGKAAVIADQTGIGKGRQAASIIRWAARQGMTPVFVSVKPSLFTDMYGDLADIGTHDVQPFIMNSDAWVAGEDGSKLFANKPTGHRNTLQRIADTGRLPEGSNAVFMTYSQINVANVQRQALMALTPNAVFVLDESHHAAGASATGDFVISALDAAKGVTYLSATYAKRPDNMPLYFKTDIGDAAADADGLALAMSSGGLPLQTVVSNNLVKAGQMFRRERSYDGVSIVSKYDAPHRELHERMSDEATKALRAIVAADRRFHEGYVKQLKEELAAGGATVQDSAGNQLEAGVQHTEFSSVVHNFVKQMLLGLKAQAAADDAIESLRRGEKPIIAVENTMGSFLTEYAAANGIGQGDSLGSFDYRTVLTRALARSRVIIEVLPTGDKNRRPVPLSELDAATRAAYDEAQAVIDGLTLDIPVSPIDWMRAEIARAGFQVAEITGRNLSVDYSDPKKPVLAAIDALEQKDKVNTTRQFNAGKLDALILNVAGSTGISLHASEKFEDQRQRHMIVAQAAGDINTFMQMLGRVHRTGQVRLPKYTILSVDLPTEKRPTAVLSIKMKSLNANTSSNTESATSVKSADILNKYGDQIVNQYLRDNLALARALDIEQELGDDPQDDIARKATGRLALQPIEVQHAFYDEVEGQYSALIDYLNKTNQNDLEPRTFDFDAKEIRQEVLFEGPNKDTPFGEDAIYGEYSIKAQGAPMTPAEIMEAIADSLNGQTGEQHSAAMVKALLQTYADQINADRAKHGLVPGNFDEDKYAAFMKSVYGEQEAGAWVQEAKNDIAAGRAVRDVTAETLANGHSAAGIQFIKDHAIGKTFRVDINSEPFNAVVTNIRSTHKTTGSPFSMSKIQLTVAVNGALRSLTVPATQFRKIEVMAHAPFHRIEQLFKEQPPNQRETAKIVTGNLLAAYGELQGVRGTIITFTKQDGTSEQGILLPKLFDYTKNTRGDYRLPDGAAALGFLQKSEDKDIGRFGIMSRDGVLRVLPAGRGVRVQVPKSKLKGAKYFLDKDLIAAGGDFVSSGSFMVATVYEPQEATKMLDLLMKKQALYALPSMADEARRLGGEKGAAMFSRTPDTRAAYEARIDALYAGGKPLPHGVRVLDRSDMLGLLGMGSGPVHLVESKVEKGRFNHGLSAADWKKVPGWLDDPAMVFDSETQPGRLVFIAPEMVNGSPVRMIVDPRPDGQGVNLLVNAYDADRNPFQRWERDGLMRYFDQQKAPSVTGSFQPRLTGLPGDRGRNKILTEKHLGGYRRANTPAAFMGQSAPPADSDARNVATQLLVDGLKAKWTRAPEIIVARNMQDTQIPQAVRDYDETLKSQGATGEARGFIYRGKVYLLSDQLMGPQQIAEVLFHEALGHYGLRGVFGKGLDSILQQMGTMRRADVVAKAREYGLFDSDALGIDPEQASSRQIWEAMSAEQRLEAAEEVLAEMAQAQPNIGFVQRAIAAIRNWLRAHVPGFERMRLTDADIVQAYILPARGYVTRSNETAQQAIDRAMTAFSRSSEPVSSGAPDRQGDGMEVGDDIQPAMFSRAAVAGMASKARDELNRTFAAPGKLSWWHKTVGTMYNLAERSPVFKRVFDSAQGFVDDVSHYATDAAELAPKLLPKLETWRDIAKRPISAADNAAVAKPVFEGTLDWARDESGKPVRLQVLLDAAEKLTLEQKAQRLLRQNKIGEGMLKAWQGLPLEQYEKLVASRYESQMLKAGIVWTPAELKSQFKLNDAQVALYQEFRAATDRSLDTMARSDMLRFGGEDVKDLADMVMDAPSAQDAAQILRDHLLMLAKENPDRAGAIGQLANGMLERAARVQELQEQGYAPLSRFGKYTVDVVDAGGERQYFGLFETAREANIMAMKMRKGFGQDAVTQGTLSDEEFKLLAGITPESLELFGNMLGLDATGDDAQDQAFQEYLRRTKTNRSAMRRLIHRQGIAGYSEDVGRVLASFIYSNARQTSAGLHMGDLGEAITAIPKQQGELKDAAIQLSEYVKNPQEEAQMVRGLLFAQYLGGSIASAVVNMTQPVAVSFPWLSQFGGAKQAATELGRAAKNLASRGHRYEADLAAALKLAEEEGTVSPQEVHQLMAQARGSGSLRPGDGTRAGDARAAAGNALTRLSLGWGKVFGAAEQVNRRMTFIAAYRVAKAQGMANPAAFAKKAVVETQFVYSKANKMKWGRGAVGATVMTFKTYSIAYIELLHRMYTQGGPEGKQAVLLALAVLMLMGGAGGLPFAEDAEDLVDGLAQMMGYNFNSKKAKQELLESVFGEAGAGFVERGITGLPGMPLDVSGRLGMGNLLPGTGIFKEKTDHTRDVLELVGPVGDLAKRVASGGRSILTGDVGAGLLQVSPVAVRNAAKGTDMAARGMYRDDKGYKVLDTTPTEAAMKAIGFQPASVSKVQEANFINQQAKNFYSMQAQEIRALWARGIFEQNQDLVADARAQVEDWNRKNPDQRMVIALPAVYKRVREMSKTKDQRIADTAPKAMRQALREESAGARAAQ